LKIVALPEQDTAAVSASLQREVGQVSAIIRQVLGRVFSAPSFRDIEAVWRGVKLLLDQGKTDGNVRLEIVPVVPEALDETLTLLAPRLIQTPPSIVKQGKQPVTITLAPSREVLPSGATIELQFLW